MATFSCHAISCVRMRASSDSIAAIFSSATERRRTSLASEVWQVGRGRDRDRERKRAEKRGEWWFGERMEMVRHGEIVRQ